MKICEICGKHQDAAKSHTIYTARTLSATTKKTGFKQYTTTTTFGDFEPHHYEVCRSCFMTRTFIIPLAVFALSVPLLMALLTLQFGGALFFALLPAGFAMWKLGVSSTLIRKAISSRKRGEAGDYKGYTEPSYEALPFRVTARKEALGRESAAAGARILATGERCWFCGQNQLANGTPYNVALTIKEENGQQEKTVWVPRCTACEAEQLGQQGKIMTLSMVVSFVAIGLGVLAGVLTGDALGGWAVLVGFVVFFAVVAAGIAVIRRITARGGKEQ